jgi:transposase
MIHTMMNTPSRNTSSTVTPTAAAPSPAQEFAAFVAIDWADQKHELVLLPADGQTRETLTLEQTPEALADWVAQLYRRFAQGKIAVILEQSRGALLYALLPYERLELYPINPRTSAKFREAFYSSGAKDDPLDAGLMLDILLHHRDRLQAWRPDEPTTRQLQLLVEARRRLVADQVRLTNRLRSTLKSYFPQALELAGAELSSPLACAFIQKWPTLPAAQQVKASQLRKFYYGHRCRSEALIAQRLQHLAQAQPLTTDAAVVAAQSLLAQSTARELATLPAVLAEYDRRIAELLAQHADGPIWQSFPGAGPALAPRLAAAWGTQRQRFPDSQAMSCYSGIAPVKEASGRSVWIHWRWACPKFLRQTFHEMAKCSLPFCPWARNYYQKQIQRGKSHQAAIRALAFKWQRIMWRCWQDHTLYDDAQYVAHLKLKGSDLDLPLPTTPAPSTGE